MCHDQGHGPMNQEHETQLDLGEISTSPKLTVGVSKLTLYARFDGFARHTVCLHLSNVALYTHQPRAINLQDTIAPIAHAR